MPAIDIPISYLCLDFRTMDEKVLFLYRASIYTSTNLSLIPMNPNNIQQSILCKHYMFNNSTFQGLNILRSRSYAQLEHSYSTQQHSLRDILKGLQNCNSHFLGKSLQKCKCSVNTFLRNVLVNSGLHLLLERKYTNELRTQKTFNM